MTLEELLNVVNENTLVEVLNADTGEILMECADVCDHNARFMEDEYAYNEYLGTLVMDVHVWNNILNICIDVEEDEYE